jgi:trk system potassium uptake protein TrkH
MMSQAKWLLIAFVTLICLGTAGLSLPGMTTRGDMTILDACFTATSAVCVTGLTVVDTEQDFTFWGQVIILILIQCGGIGIITIASSLILSSNSRLSLEYEGMLNSTVAVSSTITFRDITSSVIRFAVIIEGIGALLLWLVWPAEDAFFTRCWYSLFHAISAFCNAGFSVFSRNLEGFTPHYGVNIVIMGLVILGGFGFVNLHELVTKFRAKQFRWRHFSLFLKVGLAGTVGLNVFGTLVIFFADRHVALSDLSFFEQWCAAAFHAVSTRTAGFNTIPIADFTEISLVVMILYMFIGGISGSCAGGVKVNSLAAIISILHAYIRNNEHPVMFNRRLSNITQRKAFTLFFCSFVCITLSVCALYVTEGQLRDHTIRQPHFLAYLFEMTSALGTVGLSTGITARFTVLSKCLVIVFMFIGRLGPLVVISAWMGEPKPKPFTHPEESLPVG